MVSTSEGVVYYCTVFLTAIVFLTEASAIATNYEKSTTQNKTNDTPEISPQRTKLVPTRSRGGLSKNQNHDRVNPLTLNKLKANTRLESVPQNKTERGEVLLLSNSGGENDVRDKGGGSTDDEDQKTLSQQVADGKYGLIQHEIFTAKPSRPGVISYDVNPEVPKDNINNLGGLEPDDIWLAENHLLVLAGSGLSSMQNQWRPIDNYEAPKHQVQIPPNPKVPPPFPVQLSENGPIEYIKSDSRPLFPPVSFFNPLLTQYNASQGQYAYGKSPFGLSGQSPYPHLKPSLPINPNRPIPSPIHVKPPPGAEFIPPYLANVNTSEAVDEDDPSLYYPPPYDFYYPKDNTTRVPPGPLVPGIVLPPPPDFFALWLNTSTRSKDISKLTIVKDKLAKQQNIFKSGKQLHYPTVTSKTLKPEIPKPKEPSPPKYITFNDIVNDVTYPDTHDDKIIYADVKVNKMSTDELNEEWIPIPAPKPFYITGDKKPSKNTILVAMEPPEDTLGYNYDKPPTQLKISAPKKPLLKYLQYVDNPEPYLSTTPISPQIASTKSSLQDDVYTTTPLSSFQAPTIKATYYFYEEPQFNNAINAKPPFSTAPPTVSTAAIDFNNYLPPKPTDTTYQLAKSNQLDDNVQPVIHGPTPGKKRKPVTPLIPIYYLAELEHLFNQVKPTDLPSAYKITTTTPQHSKHYTTTTKPTYSINNPSYERPTSKPIVEYNYIASGYNPSPNQVPHSTPSPNYEISGPQSYQIDYNSHYEPPQYNPHFYNPIPRYNTPPIQTTAQPFLLLNHHQPQDAMPSYVAFNRPWLPSLNLYNPFPYNTENPYYAFFTKEEEDLIDENTKKYFTIFGQKIKQNMADVTTPLSLKTSVPPTTVSPWRSTKYTFLSNSDVSSSSDPVSSTPSSHLSSTPSISSISLFPSQSSPSPYFSSTTPYSVEHTSLKTQRRPTSSTTSKYINISSTGNRGTGNSASSTNKPLSLEGDTLVNYVTPLPQTNPDAEYVTPSKISSHIRPIVVEDLPADLNERLKNIMKLQGSKAAAPGQVGSKTRYVLIDNEYDGGEHYVASHRHIPDSRKYGRQPAYTQPQHYSHQVEDPSTPVSLKSDIRVNYKSKQSRDPNAEYVATSSEYGGSSPEENVKYVDEDRSDGSSRRGGAIRRVTTKDKLGRNTPKPVSLKNDILVNYKQAGRLTTDADAEYIGQGAAAQAAAVPFHTAAGSNRNGAASNNGNRIISYSYPGVEHGHFYFLTPQEAHLTQIEDERYDFQSNVEKPSSYFKRKLHDFEETTQKSEKSR